MAKFNTTRVLIPAAIWLLSGCASTRDFAEHHPVATGVVVAIVAGSIAASVANHGDTRTIPHCHQQPAPLDCRPIM